jgi:hypothetical protein
LINYTAGGVQRFITGWQAGNGFVGYSYDTAGNFIGTTFAVSQTSGWMLLPLNYGLTTPSAANMTIDSGGNVFRSTSSVRYKEDLKPYVPPKDVIDRLQPVSFREKKKAKHIPRYAGDRRYVGFTAEAVAEAGLAEFVDLDPEGRPDAIFYSNMVALLVAELQSLRTRVAVLEGQETPKPKRRW